MNQPNFGFIGCGNMGGALACTVSKVIASDHIFLCDTMPEKATALSTLCGGQVCDTETLTKTCDYIFLGAKPQGFAGLFDTLRPFLNARAEAPVLISMAAGLSISAIEQMAEIPCPIIRIMPNTPVSVGEGMILYAVNGNVTPQQEADFAQALSHAGRQDKLAEEKIDAASALSGCGPAFVYQFIEALADGAVDAGLPRDKALMYAEHTVAGAALLALQSGEHPGKLKDAVCSPGGSTIEGVRALEAGAFRSSVMEAVIASYNRTKELGK